MDISHVIVIVLVVIGIAVLIRKNKKRSANKELGNDLLAAIPESAPDGDSGVLVDRIVIGQSPYAPIITIEEFHDFEVFQSAKPISVHSCNPINKLNALIQAVPSLLVAGATHGKNLMEVVINGDLVRAADGQGFRPYAMSDGKITEQARLLEAENLKDMINAAAIWQIASVIVAQKHLADISQSLDDLKNGIVHISEYLDIQRRARIEGTYEYLSQAYVALTGGDLPQSVRIELESCERDLMEIQRHLEIECQQRIGKKVEHSEQFGTEELTKDIGNKISKLEALVKDIDVCTRTRIAAWHVLSLFPGDPHLKVARRQSIEKSVRSFAALGVDLEKSLSEEIKEIQSFWNRESTLRNRRESLKQQCLSAARDVDARVQNGTKQISISEALLLRHDQPSRLLIQIEGGHLIDARQAA